MLIRLPIHEGLSSFCLKARFANRTEVAGSRFTANAVAPDPRNIAQFAAFNTTLITCLHSDGNGNRKD